MHHFYNPIPLKNIYQCAPMPLKTIYQCAPFLQTLSLKKKITKYNLKKKITKYNLKLYSE